VTADGEGAEFYGCERRRARTKSMTTGMISTDGRRGQRQKTLAALGEVFFYGDKRT